MTEKMSIWEALYRAIKIFSEIDLEEEDDE